LKLLKTGESDHPADDDAYQIFLRRSFLIRWKLLRKTFGKNATNQIFHHVAVIFIIHEKLQSPVDGHGGVTNQSL